MIDNLWNPVISPWLDPLPMQQNRNLWIFTALHTCASFFCSSLKQTLLISSRGTQNLAFFLSSAIQTSISFLCVCFLSQWLFPNLMSTMLPTTSINLFWGGKLPVLILVPITFCFNTVLFISAFTSPMFLNSSEFLALEAKNDH